MNGAELKTLRESLGLSAVWIAEMSGVRVRTAEYWESGRIAVPKDVIELMEKMEKMAFNMTIEHVNFVLEIRKKVREKESNAVPEITLLRYRNNADFWEYHPEFFEMGKLPTTFHGIVLSRIRKALFEHEIPSRIVYFNPAEYEEWLEDNGLEDSSPIRAQWASLQ